VEDLPVLVVAGSEDVLVSLKSAQIMASKLVNSVSLSTTSSCVLHVVCISSKGMIADMNNPCFASCAEASNNIRMWTLATRRVCQGIALGSFSVHLKIGIVRRFIAKIVVAYTCPSSFLLFFFCPVTPSLYIE
jgi:hypothetical protein